MAKFKVNIFYIFSAMCTLLLIGYFWFAFLPQFEGYSEYPAIKTVISSITALLLVALGIQVFLAIRTEKEP